MYAFARSSLTTSHKSRSRSWMCSTHGQYTSRTLLLRGTGAASRPRRTRPTAWSHLTRGILRFGIGWASRVPLSNAYISQAGKELYVLAYGQTGTGKTYTTTSIECRSPLLFLNPRCSYFLRTYLSTTLWRNSRYRHRIRVHNTYPRLNYATGTRMIYS